MAERIENIEEVKVRLAGYLAGSLQLLRRSELPDDDAVHDIRVNLKKSRAVLKLLESRMKQSDFKREYDSYRDMGRALASWRDSSVHRKTLKLLQNSHPAFFTKHKKENFITIITGTAISPANGKPDMHAVKEKIETELRKAAYRLRFLKSEDTDLSLYLSETEKSYQTASRICLDCRWNPRPEQIHELRKRAKDLLYQLSFVRILNPLKVKSLEKRLEDLTQDLGKYNDLTQLIKAAGYKKSDPGQSPLLTELFIIARNSQDKYLSAVWSEAFRIFVPGKSLADLIGPAKIKQS